MKKNISFVICAITIVIIMVILSTNPLFKYGTWKYNGSLHGTYKDKNNDHAILTIDLKEEKYYYYDDEHHDKGDLSTKLGPECTFTSGRLEGAIATRQKAKGHVLLTYDEKNYYFYKVGDTLTWIGYD